MARSKSLSNSTLSKLLVNATTSLEQGDYAKSESFLKKALKIDQKNDEVFHTLSLVLKNQEKYSEYLKLWKNYKNDDDKPHKYYHISEAYFYLGDFQTALSYIDKSIKGDTNSSNHNLKSRILLELEKFDESLVEIDRAIEINPGNAGNFIQKGDIYRKQDKHLIALEYFLKSKKIDDSPSIVSVIVSTLEKLERYDEALLELENSLKKYPDDVILLNAEAGIYRSMGNYKETIRIVTKALKISPNETFLKRNLGRAYLENKDYEKAIKLLSDLNEKQNDDLAVCYLSDAYVATNNFAKAISILKKAHKKSPQNTMIIANLMDLYYLSKDYEQAEIYGKKFEKLLPNNPKIYSVMGFIYRYLKNYEQSLAYFNKYLMLIPNDVDTLYNIACLKSINHEFIEALAILKLVVVSDKKYKKMAKDDPDFDLLKNNLEFKKIMK